MTSECNCYNERLQLIVNNDGTVFYICPKCKEYLKDATAGCKYHKRLVIENEIACKDFVPRKCFIPDTYKKICYWCEYMNR